MNKLIGLTDSHVGEDEFGIGYYITGINQFSLNCDTPMAISIHGAWWDWNDQFVPPFCKI